MRSTQIEIRPWVPYCPGVLARGGPDRGQQPDQAQPASDNLKVRREHFPVFRLLIQGSIF